MSSCRDRLCSTCSRYYCWRCHDDCPSCLQTQYDLNYLTNKYKMTKNYLLLTSHDPDQVLQIITHRMTSAIIKDRQDIWKPGATIHLWKGITADGYSGKSQHYADVPVHMIQEIKFIYSSIRSKPVITLGGKIIHDHESLALKTGHENLMMFYRNYNQSYTGKLITWLPEKMNMINFLSKFRIKF